MFLSGLNDYLLPCLNKQILGFDCLGCGMQRATVHLFTGEFAAAFKVYPAIFTLFLFAGFMLLDIFIKIKYSESIKAGLMIVNVSIILLSYFFKHII